MRFRRQILGIGDRRFLKGDNESARGGRIDRPRDGRQPEDEQERDTAQLLYGVLPYPVCILTE